MTSRETIKAKVLDAMTARADAHGMIRGVRVIDIARQLRVSNAEVSPAIKALIAAGTLTRVSLANNHGPVVYRLGGEPAADAPISSIEAVTRHISNRNWMGASDAIPTIEISVARVRFLEGTRI